MTWSLAFLRTLAFLPASSLCQFPSLLCPLTEGRNCKRQSPDVQGGLPGLPYPSASRGPSAELSRLPCVSARLFSLRISSSDELSWNEWASQKRSWFSSTVDDVFQWLPIGYLGYGQRRQKTGGGPSEAMEKGSLVSGTLVSAWLATHWPLPSRTHSFLPEHQGFYTHIPILALSQGATQNSMSTTRLQHPGTMIVY